jgi:hypothetical protein
MTCDASPWKPQNRRVGNFVGHAAMLCCPQSSAAAEPARHARRTQCDPQSSILLYGAANCFLILLLRVRTSDHAIDPYQECD